MKTILIMLLTFYTFLSWGQVKGEEDYYYYNGQKKTININKKRFVVFFDKDVNFEKSIKKEFSTLREISNDSSTQVLELIIDDTKKYEDVYKYLKNQSKIKAIESVIGDTLPVMVSNIFYAKLKNESDTLQLKQLLSETKTKLLRRVDYMDKWFVIQVDKKSISNTIAVSNIFYESGYFEKVDPGFMFDFSNNCVTDSRFVEQWAIDGVGVDIKACDAWLLTTGNSNVKLAIIDQGIDVSHNEFSGTNFTNSFDAYHSTTSSQVYGYHGTHVAGIIAANRNQSKIAGIAPNLSIMNISHPLSTSVSTISEDLAIGIYWATLKGASIISNSWGDQGGALYNQLHSSLLEEAISFAIQKGRNGLGCIVVYASGNKSPNIDYPAYYHPKIMVVGAIDIMGKRANYSGYGNELDIMAPGTSILSTMPNNEYQYLDGTSMATPHISAVAGLILSVNPTLTQDEVMTIIESTAQKIGGYEYVIKEGRPNGTWNSQMGYGLVNAYAAVTFAKECQLTNFGDVLLTTNSIITGCRINTQNVTVQNNAKLTLDATLKTVINGPFEVKQGATLEIK